MLDGSFQYNEDRGFQWAKKRFEINLSILKKMPDEYFNCETNKIVSLVFPFVSFCAIERCYQYQPDNRIKSKE